MCPACITTAALVVAGASSTGGLIALGLKMLPAKAGATDPASQTGGEQDESPKNRITG